MFYFWLIISTLFLIFEISSPGLFYFLSFSIASMISAVVTFWSDLFFVQAWCFIFVTIFIFGVIRICMKTFFDSKEVYRFNVYAMSGKIGIVTKEIKEHCRGEIKVMGQTWSAKSESNKDFPIGSLVEVVKVIGVCLIVKLKSN